MTQRIIIRADISVAGGAGHAMRCLALTEAASVNGLDTVLQIGMGPGVAIPLSRFALDGVTVAQVKYGSPPSGRHHPDWYVLDLPLTPETRLALRKRAAIAIFDDTGTTDGIGSVIVTNQNVGAHDITYNLPDTVLLLGPTYAQVRSEIVAAKYGRTFSRGQDHIFLTIGGTQTDGFLARTADALRAYGYKVMVGGSVTDRLTTPLAWANIGVIAGGITAYEMACAGLPCLMVTVADNQMATATGLHDAGVHQYLGPIADVSPDTVVAAAKRLLANHERREMMSRLGQLMVDGLGAYRLLAVMCNQTNVLAFRPVTIADAALTWAWANELAVRAASFTPDPIHWSRHVEWLEERLASPNCLMSLLCYGQVPVGIVRHERRDDGWLDISYSVDRQFRGRGLGKVALRDSEMAAIMRLGSARFRARVYADNTPSIRAFEATGYERTGGGHNGSHEYIEYHKDWSALRREV